MHTTASRLYVVAIARRYAVDRLMGVGGSFWMTCQRGGVRWHLDIDYTSVTSSHAMSIASSFLQPICRRCCCCCSRLCFFIFPGRHIQSMQLSPVGRWCVVMETMSTWLCNKALSVLAWAYVRKVLCSAESCVQKVGGEKIIAIFRWTSANF